MAIKVKLKELLEERDMTVAQLSRKTGLTQHGLGAIYHEKRKGIEYETLDKICAALDISVGDILEYVPDEE